MNTARRVLLIGLTAWSFPAAATENTRPDVAGLRPAANTVSASLDMPENITAVRAMLADAKATISASPDVLGVTAVAADGCERVDVSTRGLFRPLHYIALRCPHGEGYTEDLLESDDFASHHVEWELSETGTGTRVTVSARIETTLPVPQGAIDSAVQRSLVAQLKRIKALLGR